MATKNIGGDPNDFSYRYKMPKMQIKVEGRGNGIKTRIVNMHQLGKSLHRNPAYITKYFGCELGAQSKYDKKIQLSVVNGNHDLKTFEELLDDFIKKFVLCPQCDLPETSLFIKKGDIHATCAACGFSGANAYPNHRLSTFIIKNPPAAPKIATKGDNEKDEESGMPGGDFDTSKLANTDEKEVEWYTDTSAEAAKKRRENLLAGSNVAELVDDGDDSTSGVDSVIAKLRKMSASKPPSETAQYFTKAAKANNWEAEQKICVLFEAFFDKDIRKQIKKHAKVVSLIVKTKRQQRTILGCIEKLIGEMHPEMTKDIVHILHGMYEHDVLSEEVIIAWSKLTKTKWVSPEAFNKIKAAAASFIDWLQAADEESDEE